MARDRQRAKQRRDQRARQGGSAPPRPPRPPRKPAQPDPEAQEPAVGGEPALEQELPAAPDEPVAASEPDDSDDADPAEDELDFDFDTGSGGTTALAAPPPDPILGGGPRLETAPMERGRGGEEDEQEYAPAPRAERGGLATRATAFIQGCWRELQRVQWPDRKQVLQATAVVIGFVVVAGLYLGVLDVLWQKVVDVLI